MKGSGPATYECLCETEKKPVLKTMPADGTNTAHFTRTGNSAYSVLRQLFTVYIKSFSREM